jgi:hypothetical protein
MRSVSRIPTGWSWSYGPRERFGGLAASGAKRPGRLSLAKICGDFNGCRAMAYGSLRH